MSGAQVALLYLRSIKKLSYYTYTTVIPPTNSDYYNYTVVMQKVPLKPLNDKGQIRIGMYYGQDRSLQLLLKNAFAAQRSSRFACWYVIELMKDHLVVKAYSRSAIKTSVG